jgi:XTP/dITP diphosphohydrolase
MTNSILIASNNAHKLQEFREIFSQFGAGDVALLTPQSLGFDLDPAETADTYVGNALIKARAFYAAINTRNTQKDLWVMADDSGLEVDALGGRPGLFSARYHKAAPNGDGCTALLREMTAVPADQRSARFRAVIALVTPAGTEHVFEGLCEGRIGYENRGVGGFGFDPVFRVANDARHLAELSAEEKHVISHRGVAARQVIAFLHSGGKV